MRELYKPKPDREIVLARSFAVDLADLAHVDLHEDHVVAKVQRLLEVLLRLGDGLSAVARVAAAQIVPSPAPAENSRFLRQKRR